MATNCSTQLRFSFQPQVCLDFRGGSMTTDPGLLLLRELDHRQRLLNPLDRIVEDPRDKRYVAHPLSHVLRQRIYQIAAGYEDGIDANLLRHDPTFQAVVDPKGSGDPLAGQSTISRLENGVGWADVHRMADLPLTWFLRHGAKIRRSRRQEILLDVDSTDDPTHGHQQLALFHGKYNTYMYHPLLIFEGHTGHLLSSRLRPGRARDGAGLLLELQRLVPRLRQEFRWAPIRFRADAGFACPALYEYLESEGIEYLIGIPHHKAFRRRTDRMIRRAQRRFDRTGAGVRIHSSFFWRAGTWTRRRRILVKVEVSAKGVNVRCAITNRPGRSADLFAEYNRRGEVENRIDELKNDLAAGRLSCSRYRANAFRLQLHTLAYNMIHLLRQWLRGTPLERAEASTIRLKLFKVGARVFRTVRRLWVRLATGWPHRDLFIEAHRAIRRRAPTFG
ncbi:MAG: IS1380 family transposase [Candidatus Eisenbacteria bacterium]|nr:IS1380 family transposase [Candidatus Eisenbacteria bacterium]